MVGVGIMWAHADTGALKRGGNGLYVGQSGPFLGGAKGLGGLAPGRARPSQDRACKKRPIEGFC